MRLRWERHAAWQRCYRVAGNIGREDGRHPRLHFGFWRAGYEYRLIPVSD
jgi:hypothetical protein